ncbi:MAG: ChaN family lipoprotein [Owenweeksia sp.]|nr:ChaN family lipoprotein [Owenweeksia sp.]
MDLARDSGHAFIATNIPRRFARMVYHSGFEALDSLNEEQKAWVAPLPITYNPELPGYKKMRSMMEGHGGENLPKAQAIKDVTMAHFILNNLPKGGSFLHFNGDYHSANFEGIGWYLKQKKPELKVMTISTRVQANVGMLEKDNQARADFIIVVDKNMTASY